MSKRREDNYFSLFQRGIKKMKAGSKKVSVRFTRKRVRAHANVCEFEPVAWLATHGSYMSSESCLHVNISLELPSLLEVHYLYKPLLWVPQLRTLIPIEVVQHSVPVTLGSSGNYGIM